jgi:glycosyltransferase involved in cell wall biosynthesis
VAKKYGVKVVCIPMHESMTPALNQADLMICTCHEAWRKSTHPNKRFLFLPIGRDMFEYRNRTGHTFVTNAGYGGVHDRRQVGKVTTAFAQLKDPEARLIVRSQSDWWPDNLAKDERITYIEHDYPKPSDIYEDGDISILPLAYGGYERGVLESMVSGMPCLTTNADPMNLYQHNPDLLIEPSKTWNLNSKWVKNTAYHEVSVDDLKQKLEWLLEIDTAKYSAEARKQAEAQTWESDIPYKDIWLETLEELCTAR